MITSEARVHDGGCREHGAGEAVAAGVPGVWIRVQPCPQPKCVRCWQHRADVGASAEHPQLCGRCIGNLSMPGEVRAYC